MNTVDYFKLQAKNLMRDWNTHQEDEELGYVYTPQFFDIDGLLVAFGEDETKFCLQRAQHLIARMVGFRKWNDLIKASEGELCLAKLVFDACKASGDMVVASEDWKMYFHSNGIDHLPIEAQIEVAERYFRSSESGYLIPDSEPIKQIKEDEKRCTEQQAESDKRMTIQDIFDKVNQNLKPLANQVSRIVESLKPLNDYYQSAFKEQNKYAEQLSKYIDESIRPLEKQLAAIGEETTKLYKKFYEALDSAGKPTEELWTILKNSIDYPWIKELPNPFGEIETILDKVDQTAVQGYSSIASLKPMFEQEMIVREQINAFMERQKALEDYLTACMIHN